MKRILPALALAAGLASFAPGCSKKAPPPKPVEPTTAPETKPAEPDAGAKVEDAAAKAEDVAAKPPEQADAAKAEGDAAAVAGDAAAPAGDAAAAAGDAAAPVAITAEARVKKYQDCWSAINDKKLDDFKACFAEGFSDDFMDSAPMSKGWDEFKATRLDVFLTAFPDLTGKAQFIFQIGDHTFGVQLFSGTHTGVLKTPGGDVPATNKKFGLLALHHVEWDPAKELVVKQALSLDMGTMLAQLGLSPEPVRPVIETGAAEPTIVIAKGDDAEKANVATFTKHVDGFNKHDGAAMLADAGDKFVWSEQPFAADTDKAGFEAQAKGMWAAFSDLAINPTWVGGAGNFVVATGRFKGTNDGENPAMKMPKTGKSVDIGFYEIMQLDGGKITGSWVFYNEIAIAMQLGLMPPPPAPK